MSDNFYNEPCINHPELCAVELLMCANCLVKYHAQSLAENT